MTTNNDYKQYTDKYFLRTREVLEKDGLNPFVRAQVFVRKGPGVVKGLDEAVSFLAEQSNLEQNGGRIYALKDGDKYDSRETLMTIDGRVQDIVEFETMYLGMIAAGITKENDNSFINPEQISQRTRDIVDMIGGRPLTYFGARHWHYDEDEKIARAAIEGGAVGASTDIGARVNGTLGVGTIPHALENIYAYEFGKDNAVLEATKAFDKYIDGSVPRMALIDYNNKEIDDSISVANTIKSLKGVRVDTCGENVAQGGLEFYSQAGFRELFGKDLEVPQEDLDFWVGRGVTVSGVYSLRKALDENGFADKSIMLTSGFGNRDKVRAFARAEEILETKLFDGLGVGTLYHSRAATMDIVAAGDSIDMMTPVSKVGRLYRPNSRLELRVGGYSKAA